VDLSTRPPQVKEMEKMSSFETRIVFFQVDTPLKKVQKIVDTVQSHFEKKEHFLIVVEDSKAQTFLDELLWKEPNTSFLPHVAIDHPSSDRVVITKTKKNINQALFVFNLCSTPLFFEGPFKIIYELEDLTTLNKKNLSTLRFDAYKQAGLAIESR
jgi:DNA polymerase-3 subunit chi